MPPVAPLPHWPIDGLEFDRSLHLQRVLDVFGCHPSCPLFPTAQDHEYVSGAFSNQRHPETGMQLSAPGTRVLIGRLNHWFYRQHDHPVDSDLVFQYPRFHSFPFLFSRPITIGGFDDDDGRWTVNQVNVADIHLRWSEIGHGVRSPAYTPSRYPEHAYPFDRAYFRAICAQFKPLFPDPSSDALLAHSETGLIVSRCSYHHLMDLIISFDASRRPADTPEPRWYLLRVPTSTYVREFQQHT